IGDAGSPTEFKITLYKIYISENADCSDPVLLTNYGSSGEQFDLFTNPTLFSGSPADGTYHCMILEFNDVMKFKADDEAVTAHAGCEDTDTEYSFDVYRDGEPDDGLWLDIDGNAIDATGTPADPSNDHAFAYASTAAAATDVLAGGNPIDANQFVVL